MTSQESITAEVGDTLTLTCRINTSTPVAWYFWPRANKSDEIICFPGRRFALDTSVRGNFNLVTAAVTVEDTGIYICRSNISFGVEHRVILNVKGNTRKCMTILQCTCKLESEMTISWAK